MAKNHSQLLIPVKKLEKTFVLQHDQSDCGVACLLSLVKYYGGNNSLEKLRELSGTTRQGTTLLGLYQAANQIGFTAQGNSADIQAVIEHGEPLILHVLIDNKLQHYVVCYGYENGKFIIGDPGKGIIRMTQEELDKIWVSKACLTLSPNEEFIRKKTEDKNKRKWFVSLVKEDKNILIFSFVLGIFIAALGLVMAVFSQKLIDDILPSKNLGKLVTGIVLVGLLLMVRVGFNVLRDYFLITQSKNFNNRIIDSFYSALLHLPKAFFDTRKIGELVARLNDTQRIQKVINLLIGNTIINLLITVTSLIFLFFYSWETGLIALFSLPVYFFIIYRFNDKIIQSQKQVMQGYALSESNYISTMQGIATIKNNNRQNIFKKINQNIYGSFQDRVFNLGKLKLKLSFYSGLFSVTFLVAILLFTSLQVYHGKMLLGELMAILGISGSLLPSVADLALIAIPLNEAKVAFNRMYEFASIKKEPAGESALPVFESLQVKNLSFRFAGRSQLLKNINIKLSNSECIAIIGENGCGKSTFGQILQKFYDYENGEIIVNNRYDFRNIKTEDWRNITGVIPQEIVIFNGNVIDNILLGKNDKPENIVAFIQEYGFEPFINSLPQGFATILGEEGINLSGGQKQIISLIRVLYKKPQLLILDEFTSAMDRQTEKFALRILEQLKTKMGIILITHRLHTISKIADKICIIENGITAHCGTHEELMRTENFYSKYWKELKMLQ